MIPARSVVGTVGSAVVLLTSAAKTVAAASPLGGVTRRRAILVAGARILVGVAGAVTAGAPAVARTRCGRLGRPARGIATGITAVVWTAEGGLVRVAAAVAAQRATVDRARAGALAGRLTADLVPAHGPAAVCRTATGRLLVGAAPVAAVTRRRVALVCRHHPAVGGRRPEDVAVEHTRARNRGESAQGGHEDRPIDVHVPTRCDPRATAPAPHSGTVGRIRTTRLMRGHPLRPGS